MQIFCFYVIFNVVCYKLTLSLLYQTCSQFKGDSLIKFLTANDDVASSWLIHALTCSCNYQLSACIQRGTKSERQLQATTALTAVFHSLKKQQSKMDPLLDIQTKSQGKQLSSLPVVRFTTLATLLVALDSLVTIGLWLAGGSSQYLEESVEDFSFITSTFDLVCLAVVRGVLFIACLYYLEHHTLVAASSKLEKKSLSSRKLANFCHAFLLILSLISFAYAVVKGSFILANLSEVTNQLHITYKILCVVAVAVPLLEVAVSISSIYFMWRLTHVLKLRLTALNLNEVEGTDGEQKKSKANLRRIALLAVPVSTHTQYHIHYLWCVSRLLLLSSHFRVLLFAAISSWLLCVSRSIRLFFWGSLCCCCPLEVKPAFLTSLDQ